MKLTRPQKKFLKKNLKKLSLGEIAQRLDVSENELCQYLKSIWPKEKYQKFLAKQKHLGENTSEVAKQRLRLLRGGIKKGFNLRTWLSQNKPAILFLSFLVLAVYTNSLGNEFISDDITGIVQNENIGNLSYYLPQHSLNFLRYLVFFLAYKIGGLNPLVFRLFNVLFHLGCVVTIYLLISLLHNSSLALITASLFAVHPILSEAIVWISGGIHAQYSFFILLSFLFYLLAKSKSWSPKYYLISVTSFLLALLTTEKAAIFPLIILSFEFSFNQIRKTWKRLTPYFLLSGVWTIAVFFGGFINERLADLASSHYQTQGFYNPFIQIPTAISSYLQLIFWPNKLTLYHSEMVISQTQYLAMLATTLTFFGIILYVFLKKTYRQYFFWLSFFVISLLPMLTPFKVAWVVAERYVYLGSLGIFVIIGLGIQKIGEITSSRNLAKEKLFGFRIFNPKGWGIGEVEKLASKISFIILAVILILLSTRTIIRNKDWRNQDTLWLAAARTSPSSPQNHNNLGDYYGKQGDFQKSIEEFKKAIELNPGYADAHHNLGNTYAQISKIEEAIDSYQKALEINPNLWQSHQNLAAIYFNQEKFDLAAQELQKAIQINSQNSNLYTNLGIIYLKLNDPQNAQNALNTALQLDPENRQAKELLYGIKQ